MRPSVAKYEVKADRHESVAMVISYATVFIATLVFIFIIFRAAYLIRQHQPNIDAFSYAETHLYIVFIEVILWTIIARAAIRFKAYTRRIKHSKDGSALNLVAFAILLSLAYAILFDMGSTFKTLFVGTSQLQSMTLLANMLPLALLLLLSLLLFIGSLRLSQLVPSEAALGRRQQRITSLSLAIFILLVIPFGDYFYHAAPAMLDDDGLFHFALPPGILIFIYLVPFVVIWLLGLLACLNLAKYAHRVPGKIYRPKFRNLYVGILISYISTYLIQIFYASNIPSNRFGFGLLFAISLVIMLIVGYSLIYRGANQLYMLEQGPIR